MTVLRFLMLTQYFPPEIGAAPIRLDATLRGLVAAGHDVEVVTTLPNHPGGRILNGYRSRPYVTESLLGQKIHRCWLIPATGAGLKRLVSYASFAAASIPPLWRSEPPDYVFVESPPLSLPLATIAAGLGRTPMILNVSDLWPDAVAQLGGLGQGRALEAAYRLEAWAYRRARFVTAVTKGIERVLVEDKGVPESKVLFLPNGVDTGLFAPVDGSPTLRRRFGLDGKRVILYTGTVGLAQKLETAVEAMRLLRDRRPEACLLVVGEGSDLDRVQHLVSEIGLPNVRFMRQMPLRELPELWSIADVGLATLREGEAFREAVPAKLLTTMASSTPVAYSGEGVGADIVRASGAGLVTSPEDSRGLAEAFDQLLGDPEAAAAAGRRGRRFVEARYEWRVLVVDWLRQLEEAERTRPNT